MKNEIVIRFTVPGEPQPWCVWTRRSKQPLTHQKMQSYQTHIQHHAKKAMAGRDPHNGPVIFFVDFFMVEAAYHRQDLTNLVKAAEDALKGIMFGDDRQVVRHFNIKWIDSHNPRTEFVVMWIEECTNA